MLKIYASHAPGFNIYPRFILSLRLPLPFLHLLHLLPLLNLLHLLLSHTSTPTRSSLTIINGIADAPRKASVKGVAVNYWAMMQ